LRRYPLLVVWFYSTALLAAAQSKKECIEVAKKIRLDKLRNIDPRKIIDSLARQEQGGGAGNWLDEVEQLARISYYFKSSRGDEPPADKAAVPVKPDNLTRREREVAALLAQGHLKEEIAEKLIAAPDTIKTHCRNIAHKWGVGQSVGELRLEAQRRGYSD
jgi:DNA-binding NarL/FixJ family response regulator